MIKLEINGYLYEFQLSKFPDGTSQVWNIEDTLPTPKFAVISLIWEGKEEEIMHVLMLTDLLRVMQPELELILDIPYLPYARQDKEISNKTTFALHTFAELINSKKYSKVYTYDAHSNTAWNLINNLVSIKPTEFHEWTFRLFKPDHVFYPDKGAYTRYNNHINELVMFGEKVRDQATGVITGYKIHNADLFDLKGKNILIMDDICDGGATFIEAAKELMKFEPNRIGLCVSHGIFSKGFDALKAAGISSFYFTNSLVKNKDGFNVYE